LFFTDLILPAQGSCFSPSKNNLSLMMCFFYVKLLFNIHLQSFKWNMP